MIIKVTDEAFAQHKQEALLPFVDKLEERIARTTFLRKAFDDAWFASLRALLERTVSDPPDYAGHAFFVVASRSGLYNFVSFDPIDVLEKSFSALRACTKKTATLDKKLKGTGQGVVRYLSDAFEILVLGRFAQEGLIHDYEPPLGKKVKGQKQQTVEAELRVGGRPLFVETTYRYKEQHPGVSFNGAFLTEDARGIHSKARAKATTQLKLVNAAAAVVVGIEYHDDNVELAYKLVGEDPECSTISILALRTLWGERLEVRALPNAAYPASPEMVEALKAALSS